MAGSFLSSCETKVIIRRPELNVTAHIFASFHVTRQKSNYKVMIDQDLLRDFGMNLDLQNNFVCWKETKMPMKSIKYELKTYFVLKKDKHIKSATYLDAKYKKAKLKEITTNLKYFNSDEQVLICKLLKKHENRLA